MTPFDASNNAETFRYIVSAIEYKPIFKVGNYEKKAEKTKYPFKRIYF